MTAQPEPIARAEARMETADEYAARIVLEGLQARARAAAAQPLAELRLDVAAKRTAVQHAEAYMDVLRAQLEHRAIEAAGGEKELGANEAARKRTLTLALEDMGAWRFARAQTEALQADLLRLQAEVAICEDDFKERRLAADLARTDAKVREVVALERIHGLFEPAGRAD